MLTPRKAPIPNVPLPAIEIGRFRPGPAKPMMRDAPELTFTPAESAVSAVGVTTWSAPARTLTLPVNMSVPDRLTNPAGSLFTFRP